MKNILKLTVVLILMVSCKDSNNSKALNSVLDEVTGKNEDINEKYDLLLKDLGTKSLLSNEQLLEAFPRKLGNLNLDTSDNNEDEIRITSSKTVLGTFGKGIVSMEILDAAGENAMSAILLLKMFHLNKVTSENDNTIRYSKKERSGILTFGTDRDKDTKADYQSELRFLYDNRFYVTIEGKGMTVDELWNTINIDDLKRFKEFNK